MGTSAGYRVLPPAPGALVAWPEWFGIRFIVTVDVEEEFDWHAPLDPRHRSTTAMAVFPAAHRRFLAAGVPLLCFADYPVATDPAAVDALRDLVADGRSTVGAQLHAWVTPPDTGAGESYAGNLPEAMEAAKLDAITAALEVAMGERPVAYRAGRYGIGPATHELLAARGYRLDSSVRARYNYRADGGPDFSAVGNAAWRDRALIMLPLTTVFTGTLRRAGPRLYPTLGRGRGVAARLGVLERVALTPEDMPLTAALRAIDGALGDGERLLCLSFHSPSLEPGHTPYVRDAADLRLFWAWWDGVLGHLARRGVTSASLGDVLAAADE